METVLIDGWLDGLDASRLIDEASVSEARRLTREVAMAAGLPKERAERVVIAASELARNALIHGRHGQFAVTPISRDGVSGVEIVCVDAGPGIPDPTRALAGLPRSTGSLGVGVASARANTDEIDFDIRLGEGTCVRARSFATSVPRRREIGVFGRPHAEEARSGDYASWHRTNDGLLLALCDGLGHGPAARSSSLVGMETVQANRDQAPIAILEACHRAMARTRGGVMAVVKVREPSSIDVAAVGNVTLELVRPRTARRFPSTSFVVGAAQRGWRAHVESGSLGTDEAIVLFSDGLPSRVSLGNELELLREPPIVIAHQLVQRFGRDTDDVLVVVAR
ncbi:MAG: ATP-binding protein [Deltaproteobacteria bacterium]|nr:ATP-binding protein [Deltaproteobacteria bacterium]